MLGRVDVTAGGDRRRRSGSACEPRSHCRLRGLLGLRRPRPGTAGAAAVRRALGAHRDARLPPGPGGRRRRRPPARRGPPARPRRRRGRHRAAGAAPPRRVPRSRRRRRRDAGAARLRARRAAGRSAARAHVALRPPLLRDRALVLVARGRGKALGADDFHAYPTIEVGLGPGRWPRPRSWLTPIRDAAAQAEAPDCPGGREAARV